MVKQLLLNIGKNEMNDKAYIAWRNKAHISCWNTVCHTRVLQACGDDIHRCSVPNL